MFRYLHGTTNHAICYRGRARPDRVLDVHGFVDVDWAGDLHHRRSTSGYVFNRFRVINLMSKKQVVVALSSMKVEYMATTHTSKEVVWLQILCL